MTLTEINIYRNVIDDTAIVDGTYTLQYTPTGSGKAKQTSGILSLVLAEIDGVWKIIRAN